MAEAETEAIEVQIWRGASEGRFQSYEIAARQDHTILDALTLIQRHQEPGLSYRFSCRVGMCGSCAMMVNDRPRWTCRTLVRDAAVDGRLRLAPLRNLPVIKDLVTDMTEFFDKWQKAGGVFKAREPENPEFSTITPDTPARQKVDAAIECINCGICYAACSMVTANKDYLGPAALNRSWSLMNDVRDGGNAERLRQAASDGGCRTCHSHQDCAEFCPKSLNPTASIAGLKRRMLGEFLKGRL